MARPFFYDFPAREQRRGLPCHGVFRRARWPLVCFSFRSACRLPCRVLSVALSLLICGPFLATRLTLAAGGGSRFSPCRVRGAGGVPQADSERTRHTGHGVCTSPSLHLQCTVCIGSFLQAISRSENLVKTGCFIVYKTHTSQLTARHTPTGTACDSMAWHAALHVYRLYSIVRTRATSR